MPSAPAKKSPKDFIPAHRHVPQKDLSKKHLGWLGEQLAVEYLRAHGYTVIDRNHKERFGELDIIAIKNGILIIVEVKSRSSAEFGEAVEAITPQKIQALTKSAQYYKLTHSGLPDELRIDVIAITFDQLEKMQKLQHIPNIYTKGLA